MRLKVPALLATPEPAVEVPLDLEEGGTSLLFDWGIDDVFEGGGGGKEVDDEEVEEVDDAEEDDEDDEDDEDVATASSRISFSPLHLLVPCVIVCKCINSTLSI